MMKRRTFIKTTAAAGAGAFVLPRFSIGQPGPSANSKLNIAMVLSPDRTLTMPRP